MKSKVELPLRLLETTDGWASPPYTHLDAKKRKHDDDNNLGRKKKNSGQPDIEESGKDISKKNYDAWKKDNKLKEWFSPNLTEERINELGIFPIRNYLKGMIPSNLFNTTTPKKKEKLKSAIRDLVSTLNHYWKSHNIPFRVKEGIEEETQRDYKAEYKKFQSSTKSKKYRAELNKYNRDKGTYGNGDGKDASHKGGKIVGFESASKNRGRAEKSRLKKNK